MAAALELFILSLFENPRNMGEKDVSALDADLTVKPDLFECKSGAISTLSLFTCVFFTCICKTQNMIDTGLGVESVYV